MTYLIIAFVIAVALAPLSHFVPSKLQRKQAKLREAAAVKGLFVEFRALPDHNARGARTARSDSIYYGLRLRPSRGRAKRSGAWVCDDQGWRPLGERVPVPEVLPAMPAGVLAASIDEGSCGIYWREAGELATVTEIHRLLVDWGRQLES